jgi:hypothetical protein
MAETEIEDITIQKIIFTDGSEVFRFGDVFVGYIKRGAFENRDTYPSLESFLYSPSTGKGAFRTMSTGIELITKERERQINEEGWTPEHDAEHTDRSLAHAARCYIEASNEIQIALEWANKRGPEFIERTSKDPERIKKDREHLENIKTDVLRYIYGREKDGTLTPPRDWPDNWSEDWFKASVDPIRNLVKAGALIAAEIDRIQQQETRNGNKK